MAAPASASAPSVVRDVFTVSAVLLLIKAADAETSRASTDLLCYCLVHIRQGVPHRGDRRADVCEGATLPRRVSRRLQAVDCHFQGSASGQIFGQQIANDLQPRLRQRGLKVIDPRFRHLTGGIADERAVELVTRLPDQGSDPRQEHQNQGNAGDDTCSDRP